MKWLCVTLLLINLCYLGWEINQQTRAKMANSTDPFKVPKSAKKLTVVTGSQKNMKSEPSPTSSNNKTVTKQWRDYGADKNVADFPGATGDAAKMHCLSFGPFRDKLNAEALYQWLKGNGARAKRRIEEASQNQYFWIYIAAKKSAEEAADVVESLRARGIEDYRVIKKGPLANAISLGVFSSRAAANRRVFELENIGHQPIIAPHYGGESTIWIDTISDSRGKDINRKLMDIYPEKVSSISVKCSETFPDS